MYMLEHQPSTKDDKSYEPLKGKPVPAPKFDFDFDVLPSRIVKYLKGKYFMTEQELERSDWKWMVKENRLWMPICRRDFTTIGGVARTLQTNITPKTLNYIWNTNVPLASYYMFKDKDFGQSCIWLVEDQISAHRLSSYAEACALLGTNISDQLIVELGQHYEDVIIALDPDAVYKALSLQKRISPHINAKVRVLKRDIKNMPPTEIYDLVGEANSAVMSGGH